MEDSPGKKPPAEEPQVGPHDAEPSSAGAGCVPFPSSASSASSKPFKKRRPSIDLESQQSKTPRNHREGPMEIGSSITEATSAKGSALSGSDASPTSKNQPSDYDTKSSQSGEAKLSKQTDADTAARPSSSTTNMMPVPRPRPLIQVGSGRGGDSKKEPSSFGNFVSGANTSSEGGSCNKSNGGASGGEDDGSSSREEKPTAPEIHLEKSQADPSRGEGMASMGQQQEQDLKPKSKPTKVTVSFVRTFMDAIMATRPKLSDEDSQKLLRKSIDKRERKRRTNRLSAKRKRQREREDLDTMTGRVHALNNTNQEFKRENERLTKLFETAQKVVEASEKNPQADLTAMLDPATLQQIGNPHRQVGTTSAATSALSPAAIVAPPAQHQQQPQPQPQQQPWSAYNNYQPPQPVVAPSAADWLLQFLFQQTHQPTPPPAAAPSSFEEQLQALLNSQVVQQQQQQGQSQLPPPPPPQVQVNPTSAPDVLSQQVAALLAQFQQQPPSAAPPCAPAASATNSMQNQLQAILNLQQSQSQPQAQPSMQQLSWQQQQFLANMCQGSMQPQPQQQYQQSQGNNGSTNVQDLLQMMITHLSGHQQQQQQPPPPPPPQPVPQASPNIPDELLRFLMMSQQQGSPNDGSSNNR